MPDLFADQILRLQPLHLAPAESKHFESVLALCLGGRTP
jgi:hypothetical protein